MAGPDFSAPEPPQERTAAAGQFQCAREAFLREELLTASGPRVHDVDLEVPEMLGVSGCQSGSSGGGDPRDLSIAKFDRASLALPPGRERRGGQRRRLVKRKYPAAKILGNGTLECLLEPLSSARSDE